MGQVTSSASKGRVSRNNPSNDGVMENVVNKNKINKTNIDLAESSVIQATDAEQETTNPGGMEMVYHISVPIISLTELQAEKDGEDGSNDKDTATTLTIGEALMGLSQIGDVHARSCSVGE